VSCICFSESVHIPLYSLPHNSYTTVRHANRSVSRVHWTLRSSQTSGTVPLYGGITAVGEYYMQLKVGGQVERVQIDTGSATTAFPLKECVSCRRGDQRYDPTKSNSELGMRPIKCSSAECGVRSCSGECSVCDPDSRACCSTNAPKLCAFFLKYGDGSGCQGALMEDEVEWAPGMKSRIVFGGMLSASSDFERSQVDGILGLASEQLACNPTCVTPAFDALRKQHKMDDVFSICITSDGGRMVLGEVDAAMFKDVNSIRYVPLIPRNPFFAVSLLNEAFEMNGESVPTSGWKTAIVDTGTTLLVLSTNAYLVMLQWMAKNMCDDFPGLCSDDPWFKPGQCVSMTEEERDAMPTLSFDVGSSEAPVKIVLRPQDYFLEYVQGSKSYYCVGLHYMDAVSGVDVILGNTVQMRYAVVFDRANQRVGLGDAAPKCKADASSVITDNGGDSGDEEHSSEAATGNIHGCHTHIGSCIECSAALGCAYNYLTGNCVNRHVHPVESLLGFPWCVQNRCVCEDRKTLRIGLLVGAGVGALVVAIVGVFGVVAMVRRRRARAQWYARGSALSSSPTAAMAPFRNETESDGSSDGGI